VGAAGAERRRAGHRVCAAVWLAAPHAGCWQALALARLCLALCLEAERNPPAARLAVWLLLRIPLTEGGVLYPC